MKTNAARKPGCLCEYDSWSGSPLLGGYARCPIHSPSPPFDGWGTPVPQVYPVEEFKPDSIVLGIVGKFLSRAKMGKEKYGTDLDRDDLKVPEWIEHAQDELMDGILYLEKLKQELANGDTKA